MIRGDNDFKDKLLRNIDERVESFSLHMSLASVNLLGIVKHMFKSIKTSDLNDFALPVNIFDQTILRNIILSPKEIDNAVVQDYFKQNHGLLPQLPRHLGDGNTYTFGQVTLMTSLKNSLTMNFTNRLKQYLKCKEELKLLTKTERIWLLFTIHGWNLNGDAYDNFQPSDELVNEAAMHRVLLGLKSTSVVTENWLKKHLFEILKHFVFINRFFELHSLPCFKLTPVFSIKRHFITIDTDVFYGLMKDIGGIKSTCKTSAFRDLAMHHYLSVFKIGTLQGKNNVFTRTIQTDGVSLIVHFTRPTNLQDKVATKGTTIDPTHRLVAIDPGRANIFFGTESLGNGKTRSFVLTGKRYYQDSGMIAARENVQKWHRSIRPNLDAITRVSPKGANVNLHSTFGMVYKENVDAIWQEHKKKRWARQRLRLYGGKKRTLVRFFQEIEKADTTRKVTIAYGSARFAPGGKGEVSVPVGRAFQECRMYFPTVVVDEFRTTAVHYHTNTMLQKVQLRRNKGSKKVVRGLLWCYSTSRKNKFVNRDLNAAMNILRCALGDRPLIMTRQSNTNVDKSVGKFIR